MDVSDANVDADDVLYHSKSLLCPTKVTVNSYKSLTSAPAPVCKCSDSCARCALCQRSSTSPVSGGRESPPGSMVLRVIQERGNRKQSSIQSDGLSGAYWLWNDLKLVSVVVVVVGFEGWWELCSIQRRPSSFWLLHLTPDASSDVPNPSEEDNVLRLSTTYYFSSCGLKKISQTLQAWFLALLVEVQSDQSKTFTLHHCLTLKKMFIAEFFDWWCTTSTSSCISWSWRLLQDHTPCLV